MTPKRFHYFFIAGLSLFCLIGIVIGYGFFLSVLRASDNLIVANNSDSQLETRITALQRLSNSVQGVSEPLQALHQAIPKDKDVPGLVADLEAAANTAGVSISDLDFSAAAVPAAAPAPTAGATPAKTTTSTGTAASAAAAALPAKPAGQTPVSFKMEAVGSYAQMTAFLGRLTHLSRYVDISQLSLIKPHKEADQVDITFLMNAYVE